MEDKPTIIADTIELILLNQEALRAGLEELSLWVSQRGSLQTHNNVLAALTTLDIHAQAITLGIESIRN